MAQRKQPEKASSAANKRGHSHKRSRMDRLMIHLAAALRFVTSGMWRMGEEERRGVRGFFTGVLQSGYISIRAYINDDLGNKASALTYTTMLSIVPMLAVITGVAKGFGVQDLLRDSLTNYLPGHSSELGKVFGFVNNYLSQVQGGLFIGVGLLILLYTVVSLIATIEDTFNKIWQCTKSRSWGRRVIDYTAMFILLPIIMVVQSGMTIFLNTMQNTFFADIIILGPLAAWLLKLIPFAIIILVFTGLYMAVPNTRVRFLPALAAGIVAGVAFQFLQALYISGILGISKYNAIYGSFAAVPLLLFFMQLSWTICLLGAQLSFAIQNIRLFDFEEDSSNVSRRYRDFLTLVITERIVRRFVDGDSAPHTADSLAAECRIPIRLCSEIIRRLLELGIIVEVNYKGDALTDYYQPAVDPDKLSVEYLIGKLDRSGSEFFRVDARGAFRPHWEAMLRTRCSSTRRRDSDNHLLKDLFLEQKS